MTDACAEHSLIQEEPLIGTATGPITHWICIEHPGAWPARFKAQSLNLPPALKGLAELAQRPNHKLLLIRGRRSAKTEHIQVFIAQPEQGNILQWTVDLNAPHIDWEVQLGNGSGTLLSHPLILVCTHGSRDRCCGVLGGATFAALHKLQPDWIWQVSHLGGHRFAPTLLSLPSGDLYGRITVDLAESFIASMASSQSYDSAYLRGNTRYPPAVQAVFAQCTEPVELVSVKHVDMGAVVEVTQRGIAQTALVKRVPTGKEACASCADTEPSPIMSWQIEWQ